MPKLDLQSANEFWKEFDDPTLYRVITFMETAEGWTLDGNPEIEAIISQLEVAFDKLSSFEVGKEEEFIGLTAHLKTSRILKFLQTIDSIDPGSASKILMYAEENNDPEHPMATFFLRRNIVFERLRLLSRAFGPDRIALLMKVLEHEE